MLIVILIFTCNFLSAQEEKHVRDSTIMNEDSTKYNSIDRSSERNIEDSTRYMKIEKISRKTRVGQAVYNLLFRKLQKESHPRFSANQMIEDRNHRTGQGKVIRNIDILTMDPFGYNIRDTSIHPKTMLFNSGNYLHSKTKASVIKNLLLFSENELYDSTLVKESERLIRSQVYIRDVYLETVRAKRDSVDIHIRVLDVWSLLPTVRISSSETGFGMRDLNFAGSGTNLHFTTRWKNGDAGNVTYISYLMPNIRNTYTSLNIQYLFSPNRNLLKIHDFQDYFYTPVSYNPQYMFSRNRNILKSIEINRPFYSPGTRWAGGVFLGQILTTQSYLFSDTVRFLSERTNITDIWLGRSWRIFRNNDDDRITSLVLSGRFVHTRDPSRTPEAVNADLFNTHNYYFGALSITSRKYFRDRYIFNYGKTEDVPAGKIAGITLGKEYQLNSRFYIGLNAGTGTYYRFGYLGAHLSYGTFVDLTGFHQGILTGRMTFFTRLLTIGDWKLRQFITPSFVFGINKSPVDNQPLRIGIKGFESIESLTSGLTVISLQTQSYSPLNIGGFHFGPFIYMHIGILGEEPAGHKGRVYSLLGLGLLVKNDFLMFNTFQISLSFYPYVPENRYNLFKANAYKTTDFGFRDFEVSKPGIVE